MERSKKEQVIEELHKKLEQASAAILTDYKGLTVAEITSLRDSLAVGKGRVSGGKEHLDAPCLQADRTYRCSSPCSTAPALLRSRSATRPFRPRSSKNSQEQRKAEAEGRSARKPADRSPIRFWPWPICRPKKNFLPRCWERSMPCPPVLSRFLVEFRELLSVCWPLSSAREKNRLLLKKNRGGF